VSRLRNRLKKYGHQGRVRISSSPYICGRFEKVRETMHLLDNTLEYVGCESNTHAGKGYCSKALPISPPALVLGILMHVMCDT
jgi:hypothetical protein